MLKIPAAGSIPFDTEACVDKAIRLIADAAANLRDGVERASQALDSGAAKGTLERLVKVSNA